MVLFLSPEVVPVTLIVKLHDVLGDSDDPTAWMSVPLPLTTTKPPSAKQLPVTPLGDAIKPLGSGSSTLTLLRVVLEFGLPKVSVRVVVPFSGTVLPPNALAIVGGCTGGTPDTVRVAVLLVAPAPLSLAEIGPVVLFSITLVFTGTETVACTSTDIKHEPLELGRSGCGEPPLTMTVDFGSGDRDVLLPPMAFACGCNGCDDDGGCNGCDDGNPCNDNSGCCGLILANPTAGPRSPPVRVMTDEPGSAVTVPSQLLLRLLGLAITKPVGKLSVNAIPVRVTSELGGLEKLFGLLMVKLNRVVWFWLMVSGRKSLLIVGAKATDKVAVASPPVPPLSELTGPVSFR